MARTAKGITEVLEKTRAVVEKSDRAGAAPTRKVKKRKNRGWEKEEEAPESEVRPEEGGPILDEAWRQEARWKLITGAESESQRKFKR